MKSQKFLSNITFNLLTSHQNFNHLYKKLKRELISNYYHILLIPYRYENIKIEVQEDNDEIEKLATWYEYFIKAYG